MSCCDSIGRCHDHIFIVENMKLLARRCYLNLLDKQNAIKTKNQGKHLM